MRLEDIDKVIDALMLDADDGGDLKHSWEDNRVRVQKMLVRGEEDKLIGNVQANLLRISMAMMKICSLTAYREKEVSEIYQTVSEISNRFQAWFVSRQSFYEKWERKYGERKEKRPVDKETSDECSG